MLSIMTQRNHLRGRKIQSGENQCLRSCDYGIIVSKFTENLEMAKDAATVIRLFIFLLQMNAYTV